MSTTVSVHVSEGLSEFDSLRTAWDQLFASGPHEPSTSYEWTRALVSHHLRPDDQCFLFQLRRNGAVVGIVPIVRRAITILRQRVHLLVPISEEYNTHSDLLIAPDDDAVSALISAMSRLDVAWDCFRMARLLEANPLVPVLQRVFDATGHTYRLRDGLPAYVLELPESFEQYLARRSSKFRNHVKRITRKLHDAGAIAVRTVERADELPDAYGAVLDVERASWKQSHGTSIAAVGRQTGFYQELALAALEAGRLHLHWLTVDGRPIAYNLGYLTAGRYHYLKTSYDHGFRTLSPSTYLRAKLIETLIAARIRLCDFPGEPYEWETQWADALRWRTVFSAYTRTIKGRALAAMEHLRHRAARHRQVAHINPRTPRAGAGYAGP